MADLKHYLNCSLLLSSRSTMQHTTETETLLTPAEVAAMFRVDPKTVTRWAKSGKLTSIRTLGGHRRYRESEVRELFDSMVVVENFPAVDGGVVPQSTG